VSTEKATFGAGCFWGVESTFRDIPGVIDAAVGYEGGTMVNPRYEDVCTDETGHAEVVELTFDPAKVSYEKLVEAFFGLHNPTTLNRQGPDVGNQYRSVIFFHSPEQERVAREVLQRAQPRFQKPIVTQVEPAQTFYKAEEYHQQYLAKRGLKHCHI
jgi:peptide-methionine (S)-S-oxide reductase